jgi:hypothetical protein
MDRFQQSFRESIKAARARYQLDRDWRGMVRPDGLMIRPVAGRLSQKHN